jgi:DNA-binding NarL/FixJ family response regulator
MKKDYIVISSTSASVADYMKRNMAAVGCDETVLFAHTFRELEYCIDKIGFPKMIFIEANFCGQSTHFAVKSLLKRQACLQIKVFTFEDIPEYQIKRFVHRGADGFINIRDGNEKLREGLGIIFSGGVCLPDSVSDNDFDIGLPAAEVAGLTDIEVRIIRLYALCEDTNSIARKLNVRPRTLTTYYKPVIYKKTGAKTTVELAWYAIIKGIVNVEEYKGVFHTVNEFNRIKEQDETYHPELLLRRQ